MFRQAAQQVPRAKPETGRVVPAPIPYKGLDARSPFAVMAPEYAISLVNVASNTYGLRSRKGFTEYANTIPGGSVPAASIMWYYAAGDVPTNPGTVAPYEDRTTILLTSPSDTAPADGKLFTSKSGLIYNVTVGGTGPWVAEAGVSGLSDYWTSVMFSNIAGTFLIACNDKGGYSYYNGATWTTPTFGAGVGQISGCDPAKFCFVMVWKKSLWFIQKGSTSAWYLPVGQITGAAIQFDFGSLFINGGELANIVNWTLDSGSGIDDRLMAIGSQGDVCMYQGTDPNDATTFSLVGTYQVGPLPAGRRQVLSDGGEVYILSQFGLSLASRLMSGKSLAEAEKDHLSYLIDPLISRMMSSTGDYLGWSVRSIPRENILIIGSPQLSSTVGGDFLVYSTITSAWSQYWDTQYADLVTSGTQVWASTYDGRVVRAFDGSLDNILLTGSNTGTPIVCRVIPAYNALGAPSLQKTIPMLRPSFISASAPALTVTMLADYAIANYASVPSLPASTSSLWGVALWGVGVWAGALVPYANWLGCRGQGYVITSQLDYACGGDTLLTGLDYWTSDTGGVL